MLRALRKLLSAAMFWVPPGRLVKITVWHGNLVIGTITDEAVLATVDAIWSRKIKQPRETKTTFRYSFDLRTMRGTKYSSTRWLYDASGLTKVMVIPSFGSHIPVYRIPSPDQLNRLVGIGSPASGDVSSAAATDTPADRAR